MTPAPSPGSQLAVLEDVSLTLAGAAGPVVILRGVSLSIAAGEAVALIGPSGSGKSSLLMVLAGLERPDGGQIVVAGQNLARLDEDGLARLRRRHVGIVFQSFHLLPTMTAAENVAIPLELAGARDAAVRAAAALQRVGLGHRLGHYPGQLSGGEQQRVAIARAMVAGPDLLLADEPTGNLDAATGGVVIDCLFEEQRRLGSGLLLITHDRALAARCGRLLHLADGRIVGEERGGARARASAL
ncbi:MAG TPA: ATP-binding cassette domain-containing protein [Stellaceae bacterium]|nr:ATP-binding cassette domain-containing protein [Stellaceae bacterium]